jgi:hypothetical protein
MYRIFGISLLVMVVIYALLSAFTSILYRNKNELQMSLLEMEILDGTASIGMRLRVLFRNLVAGFMFPPNYILAGIITFVVWLFS